MRGNFTYASSEYVEYEEPDYSDTPWLSRKGKKISQTWGLVAERLFLDEEEVKNSPRQTLVIMVPVISSIRILMVTRLLMTVIWCLSASRKLRR